MNDSEERHARFSGVVCEWRPPHDDDDMVAMKEPNQRRWMCQRKRIRERRIHERRRSMR